MNSVGGLFRVRLSKTLIESAHLIPGVGSLDFSTGANTHTHTPLFILEGKILEVNQVRGQLPASIFLQEKQRAMWRVILFSDDSALPTPTPATQDNATTTAHFQKHLFCLQAHKSVSFSLN